MSLSSEPVRREDDLLRMIDEGIAALEVLADGWRRYAIRRLESGRVEDWSKRLEDRA